MGDDKYTSCVKITREELKAYLSFCILIGINHLPALDNYWSTDPTLHYSPIADRITRDRFREISRYLYFANNATLTPKGSPGHDRLGKVRPVIDHLSSRFSDLNDAHREVAVDEAMIKFTGHSALKLYMPMKPVKHGIKVWALADSHNSQVPSLYWQRGEWREAVRPEGRQRPHSTPEEETPSCLLLY